MKDRRRRGHNFFALIFRAVIMSVVTVFFICAASFADDPTLSQAYQDKLNTYAQQCVRYFTGGYPSSLETGMTHAFAGSGKFRVPDGASMREESWPLTRGYGSHVNINEVTLRFVSLALAYKMGWESSYDLTWGQILKGLRTLNTFQHSPDAMQYHNGHFHRSYLTTKTGDVDRSVLEVNRPYNENMQSSDDNGLPYMNLLVLEGLANDQAVAIADRGTIIHLCQEIRAAIDLRDFVQNNELVFNHENGNPSAGIWDRESAEGPILLAALLLSGQITVNEFYTIAGSMENHPVNWSSFSGAIPVGKPSYHSAMFIHGLRMIHGMPVTAAESAGLDYFETSTEPVMKAALDYSGHYGYQALGTQVMTQALNGKPVFEMNGVQVEYPGNEGNHMPVPGTSLSPVTGPHAWFIPLARWKNLEQVDIDTIFSWMASFESGFFHSSADKYGWEAAIPWQPTDTAYAWRATDGEYKYTDWGRPYEALNAAYIVQSIFDALNPDALLASYSVEAERVKHIAAYFDSGTALPAELFPNPGPPADDHGNYTAAATDLSAGGTIAGAVESPGDYDYFRISVPSPGGDIAIYTTGDTDTFGYLESSDDTAFVSSDNGGAGKNFRIARYVSSRIYYVAVRHNNPDGTGSYTLHADFTPRALDNQGGGSGTTSVIIEADWDETGHMAFEDNANNDLTLRMYSGGYSLSRWGRSFTVSQAGTASFVIRHSNDNWDGTLENVIVYIKEVGAADSTKQTVGNFTASDTGDGGYGWNIFANSPALSIALNPGFYQIQYYISTGDQYGVELDCATITIPTASDDHGNDIAHATTINANSSVNGAIESLSDNDYFKLVSPGAGTLTVFTTGSTDMYGYLLNSGGGTITEDNNSLGNNFKIFQLVSGLTYYIRVKHASTTGMGDYLLHTNFSADDHGNDTGTATLVSTNTAVSGYLETSGDNDLFEIHIPASGNLNIETASSIDTYGYLLDSAGNTITYDDDSGPGNNFSITRSVTAGTYYAKVKHYSTTGTGAYALYVNFVYTADNQPPVANDQNVTTAEDTAKAITLTATDAEGSPLTYSIVASPAHGTLSGTAPNITYTPALNWYGSDSFTFKANDGTIDSNTATVSITVTTVNDAPVANSQSVTTNEDSARAITLTATDIEGSPLTYSIVTQPTHGTLSGTAPNVTYMPALNWNGSDSLTFKANDGSLNSNTATVSITITAVNDAPIANNQSVTTNEDTQKAITLTATDIEGSPLTYSVVDSPTHGTLSGTAPNVTYTPAIDYYGSDSFTFKANDGSLNSNTATVSITITAVNDAPIANNQSVITNEDTAKAITLTAADIEGSPLTYSVVGSPTHGTLSGTAPNLTYTPAIDYNGSDSFTFKANDGSLNSNTATVSITITAVNDAPVVTDIPNQTIAEGANFATIALDNYVSDVDNTDAEMTWTYSGNSQLGVSITNRIATITTPNPDWNGSETITFTAKDPGLLSGIDSAVFTVTAVNDAPVVTDIPNQTVAEGSTFATIALDNYVSDVDNTDAQMTWTYSGNSQLTVSVVSRVATITTPNPDWNGAETITFKATDPGGLFSSDAATFTVTAASGWQKEYEGMVDGNYLAEAYIGSSRNYSKPTFVDIDNDGDYDMFVGEVTGNINFYRNDGTAVSPSWVLVTENYNSIDVGDYSAPAFVDIDNDGDYDMFIGEGSGNINFYQNTGTAASPSWALINENYNSINVGDTSSPTFVDIDDDGDYDMFVGKYNGTISFYQNTGTAASPSWALVTENYNSIDVGSYCTPTFVDIDADGDYDMFIGDWGNGNINFYQNDGTPETANWTFVTGNYNSIAVGDHSAPAFIDIDNDGDYDMFIGAGAGNINFYQNTGTAVSPSWIRVTENYNSMNVGSSNRPTFVDIDNDGDYDMFIGQGDGTIYYYRNDGTPQSPSWTLVSKKYNSIDVGDSSSPTFVDIDNDGDYDMFVGGAYNGNISFYENTGTAVSPSWTLVTTNYNSINIGGYNTPTFVDIDNDGDYDMFIGEGSGNINFYQNTGTAALPSWTLITTSYNSINVGDSSRPAFIDIDNDGDYDMFVGKYAGTISFYENTGTAALPSWTLITTNYNSINVNYRSAPAFVDIDTDGDYDMFVGNYSKGLGFYRNMTVTGNTPPVISLPDVEVDEDTILDSAVDLWNHSFDAETPHSGLTYTITQNTQPECDVTIGSNRFISIHPQAGWHGTSDVTVKVEDPSGLFTTSTAAFTVTNQTAYYPIIVDEHDTPLPSISGGWYYDATGGDRGKLNEEDVSYTWDSNSAYTATVSHVSGLWTWGGMWYSLIRVDNDNVPLDFQNIFGPYIKSEYQGRIIGLEIAINNVTSPTNNSALCLRVELKDESGNVVYSQMLGNLIGWTYPKTFYVALNPPAIRNVKDMLWVIDNAKLGDSITIDKVKLIARVPSLSDVPSQEQAFLWTYSWLISNYDAAAGIVQDRSNFKNSDMENISATAKAAKITYYAYKKGYVAYNDALTIITKIADTLINRVPRGPSAINTLWPHFTKNGGTDRCSGTEWSSGDTIYAAMDAITALQMIGDPQNQIPALQNFLTQINWTDLVSPESYICHGYSYDGTKLDGYWTGFGMETIGVDWAYASATGNLAQMETPPNGSGSGFIDNTQYPMVFSGTDRWGNDWDVYRENMANTQIGYYNGLNNYLYGAGLFGLSAAEVPDISLDPSVKYLGYGTGGGGTPVDGGGEVAVLHYSGMIADKKPAEAVAMWETLRDSNADFLQNKVIISPLNNMESMKVDKETGALLAVNRLKGSWNLALQAEGWAQADSAARTDLNAAIQNNAFLKRGYDLVKTPPPPSWEESYVSVPSGATVRQIAALDSLLFIRTWSNLYSDRTIYKSSDLGANWQPTNINLTTGGSVYDMDVDQGKLYVACQTGIVVSDDEGASFGWSLYWRWDACNDVDMQNGYGWAAIINWGGMSGPIRKTPESIWECRRGDIPWAYMSMGSATADPIDPYNIAYVASNVGGSYRTLDSGAHWLLFSGRIIYTTIIDGKSVIYNHNPYSGQDSYSEDHGDTWQPLGMTAGAIIRDEETGLLFAAGTGGGIYVGHPGDWKPYGLSDQIIQSLAICGKRLFAISATGRIFYTVRVLNVPSEEYPTIQDALNGAVSGDTINVAAGTYTGDINMKDGVDLAGENAKNTIIEGNITCLESDSTIENLTVVYNEGQYVNFTNSNYTDLKILADAGITAVDSEITVRNCVIYPDLTSGGGPKAPFGKGIQIWNLYGAPTKAPIIDNTLIVHCNTGIYYYSQAFGGAINGTIQNSTLDANKYGIVLRMHKEMPLIQNNIISNSLDDIHITYDGDTLLAARLADIANNCIFIQDPSGHHIWCDAAQSAQTPTGAGNIYEDPQYNAPWLLDYYPNNPNCGDKGYRLE